MRRTKEQAAETARQILDAAENLFLEKGYDNVSVEDIATAAGITRGAVHWHFKNKQGLLLALRDRVRTSFAQLADELTASGSGASLDKLGDHLADMFERLHADPRQQGLLRVMVRIDMSLLEKDEETNSHFRREIQTSLTRIFKAIGKDAGLPPPWAPEMAASMLSATVHGLVVEWAFDRRPFNLVPEGQAFIRLVLARWRPHPKPRVSPA